MTRHLSIMLAGASLSAMASAAYAQPAPASSSSANPETQAQEVNEAVEDTGEGEIVVTARRRAESVQDVPQSVQAVSGETLEKLNFVQFEDISKVVAGLTLSRAGNVVTLRGVSFNPVAQTNPTTSFYLNEAPLQSTFIFQSMFDIGQVEVLRGPQGTLRGQSAPSGAFTITTRRPDLDEWGGFASAMLTSLDGRTFQGALNAPIIPGKVALRVAGISEYTDNGGVRSINSGDKPSLKTRAFRISLRVEPIDNLSAVLVYQDLHTRMSSLGGAVFGNGAPGGTITNSSYSAPFVQVPGYNGRPIAQGERLSVAENADVSSQDQTFWGAQVDYRFAGQKLSYVGARSHNASDPGRTFGDLANMVPGGDWPSRSTASVLTRWSHELRLSSDEQLFGFLDYVAGVFRMKEHIENDVNNGLSFAGGAFGTPRGAPQLISPNLRFSTTTFADISTRTKELSFFGNLTAHLGENTELSGGIRFINARKDGLRINSQGPSVTASRTIATQAACTAAGGIWQATYATVCDVPAAARVTGTIPDVWKKTPIVWSASASHHFTPDIMVYASAGTSWRPGPTQGALINGTNDPLLQSLVALPDEKSRSIEVGFKTSWLNDRLTFNAAAYKQKYTNLVFSVFGAIPYLVDTGVPGVPRRVEIQGLLNAPVDATIKGIDLELDYRAKRWNFGAVFGWANGKFANAVIPCLDRNFDGIPDSAAGGLPTVAQFEAAGKFIALCPTSGRSNATPKWNARLRGEYTHPINSEMEGFASFLFAYTPRNEQQAGATFVQPKIGLLNLYAGVRNPETGWEIQVWGKNILDNDKITQIGTTDISDTPSVSGLFGTSGYRSISYVERREFGITARLAFGSR